MKKHLDVTVIGKVQGVGFRYQAKELADKMGLHGYARNHRDKNVFIEIEGEEIVLNEFLDWLNSSPGLSQVTETKMHKGNIKGYREFEVY